MKLQGQYEGKEISVQFNNLNNTGLQIKNMLKQEMKIMNDIKIYFFDGNYQQKFELDLNMPLYTQLTHGNYQIIIENINPIEVESQFSSVFIQNQQINQTHPQLIESIFQSVQNENQQIQSEIQVDFKKDEIIENYDERITLLQTYIKQNKQQISVMNYELTQLQAENETQQNEKQLFEDALAQHHTINQIVTDQNAYIERMYLNIHIIQWSPQEQQASQIEKIREEQKKDSKKFKEIEQDIEQEQQKSKKFKESLKEHQEEQENLLKQIELKKQKIQELQQEIQDTETQANKKIKLNQ